MSKYLDAVTARDGNGSLEHTDLAEFGESWPELTQAMVGVKGPDGKWLVGPATVMLFLEGGKMKFCLSPKYSSRICFGCVVDPSRALDSIEVALATEKCEWKARGGRN